MLRPHRIVAAFSRTDILLAIAFLTVLSAAIIPPFCEAGPDTRRSALTIALQTVRGQLARYQEDHQGRYPELACFAEQMTLYTDPQGASSPVPTARFCLGPYLSNVPVNPYTSSNELGAAGSDCGGAWQYDEGTGEFRAAVCLGHASY
jgi:hypothetical protein